MRSVGSFTAGDDSPLRGRSALQLRRDGQADVVLYEESLDEDVMDRALRYIQSADLLIIGGTSLVVYPAAGLVRYFRGRHLVVINKGETGGRVGADLTIDGPIGEVLSQV